MTLPKYGAGQVYDYKVNGTAKDQGAVIRITGNTSLSRTAGKTWESHGLGALIAENYAAEDEAALAILSSPALLTGSFRLRTPAEQDGLLDLRVEGTEYVVTAEAYKAHTEDLWWVPESGVLVGGADDGEAVSFVKTGSDYVARIPQSADFEKVSVQYRVELSWDILDKTPEEIERDGKECGNKKLRVTLNRNGAQMSSDEYIDLSFNGNLISYEQAKQHSVITPY